MTLTREEYNRREQSKGGFGPQKEKEKERVRFRRERKSKAHEAIWGS